MKKVKASENLAKDTETKLQKFYKLPGQLQQMTVQALLTSSPKQFSVGEINQMCNALNQLKEV